MSDGITDMMREQEAKKINPKLKFMKCPNCGSVHGEREINANICKHCGHMTKPCNSAF